MNLFEKIVTSRLDVITAHNRSRATVCKLGCFLRFAEIESYFKRVQR